MNLVLRYCEERPGEDAALEVSVEGDASFHGWGVGAGDVMVFRTVVYFAVLSGQRL